MCATDTTDYEDLRRYVKQITQILLFKSNLPLDLTDDVSQSAFVRFEGIPAEKRQKISNKRAYLKAIVANVIHDHIRTEFANRRQHYADISVDDLFDSKAEIQPDDVEFRILLTQVLNQLSTDEKLLLRCLSLNYTGKELAARLRVSEHAARQRTKRLRAKLKELLLTRNI